jgi:hypothetical protein
MRLKFALKVFWSGLLVVSLLCNDWKDQMDEESPTKFSQSESWSETTKKVAGTGQKT